MKSNVASARTSFFFARGLHLSRGISAVNVTQEIRTMFVLTLMALASCSHPKAEEQEGKPLAENLRERAAEFERKKVACAHTAKTETEYADCLGVKWEKLQHDQTGIQ